MSNGTKILVTGSSGFIGSHAVETLRERGYEVKGYDIIDSQDIKNFVMLEVVVARFKPEWIVHLAGQVFLGPSMKNPQDDAMTNIIGTLNVLRVAHKYGCGVIFSSSGAVYGNNYQYPDPISPYGLSKLTAERYCLLYNRLHQVPTVVFRFSSIYGQGRKKTSINLILDKAMKDEVIQVTGDGKQTRDFTHVSDVVEAIIIAVKGEFPTGVYDIGTGVATSINGLIRLIERLLDKKLRVEYKDKVKGDPKRNELNVSKAAQYGFKAKVSFVDGLKKLMEAMQ